MKVAIYINELNIRGGTHKQVLRLCQYLENHKIEFKLLTKYYDPKKTYPEFEKCHPISLYKTEEEFNTKRTIIKKIVDMLKFIKMVPCDYDIVNIHDCHLPWLTCFFAFSKRIKTVWQINDLPHCFGVGVGKTYDGKRNNENMCRFYRWIAKHVDAITVNVTKNKERVEVCMGKSADVFYCGVDVNHALQKHSYRREMKQHVKLLSTGVFFTYRNYETLVYVVEYLKNSGYDVQLDIVGSTDRDKKYVDKINNLIEEKSLKEHVKIWGQVDEKIYNLLYNQADIFAFINIDQSWGLAVFEAMSAGMPTIVSNSVGAIELLHDDDDAIIVDPQNIGEIANKIINLINNKEYYNRVSNSAYQVVKHYSWNELYSSKMVNLFDKLLKNETREN